MRHVSLYLQLTLIILLSFGATANGYTRNKTTEIASDFDKIGWKVGIQSYTFTRYSLFKRRKIQPMANIRIIIRMPGIISVSRQH